MGLLRVKKRHHHLACVTLGPEGAPKHKPWKHKPWRHQTTFLSMGRFNDSREKGGVRGERDLIMRNGSDDKLAKCADKNGDSEHDTYVLRAFFFEITRIKATLIFFLNICVLVHVLPDHAVLRLQIGLLHQCQQGCE